MAILTAKMSQLDNVLESSIVCESTTKIKGSTGSTSTKIYGRHSLHDWGISKRICDNLHTTAYDVLSLFTGKKIKPLHHCYNFFVSWQQFWDETQPLVLENQTQIKLEHTSWFPCIDIFIILLCRQDMKIKVLAGAPLSLRALSNWKIFPLNTGGEWPPPVKTTTQ